jgi:hypothetical protein
MSDQPKKRGKLSIPLPLDKALKAATETKPPEKPKKKRPAKKH